MSLTTQPATKGATVPGLTGDLARAAKILQGGGFVLVYDSKDREAEVDLFYAAEHVTPEAVERLRRDAGGLVFLAVGPGIGKRLGLPFLHDIFNETSGTHPVLKALIPNDIRYDTRSSFSLTINHRKTFTGITDNDRALTIKSFAELGRDTVAVTDDVAMERFGASFRAPGHVHLCVGAEGGLDQRKGHTELAVALAELAGVTPVLVGAEMLGRGGALPLDVARAYADKNDTVLIEGKDIEAAHRRVA